jgi:hypothetical protein
MTESRKADTVTPKMRAHLLSNRDGKIARDQWLDLTGEPVVAVLLLVVPAAIIFGPRLAMFVMSLDWPLLVLLVLLGIVSPLVVRAFRYRRAPVHFAVLYGASNPTASLMFWRAPQFQTKNGKAIRFYKRLTTLMVVRPGQAYLVYYVEEKRGKVLLSAAPANHPDAQAWYPSEAFEARRGRRMPL